MTTTLAVISDLHVNSTVGLVKPQIQLDDGGTYRASEPQRRMWNWFIDYCSNPPKADRIIGILDGDIVEGDDKKRSSQIITRNRSTIIRMAIETLEPFLDICERVYIIRGTEAHTGKSNEFEELLAQDITTTVWNNKKVASWWYLEHTCEGVKILAAHTTSSGRLPWTFSNSANKNSVKALFYYTKLGKPPPDVAFFAHNHLFANSGRGNHPTQTFHLPAWSLPTAHANKDVLSLSDIGGFFLICDQGEYQWQKKIYQPMTSKIWKHQI